MTATEYTLPVPTSIEIATPEEKKTVKSLLMSLYGEEYDIDKLTDSFFRICSQYALNRPQDLELQDQRTSPLWYQSEQIIGYILYSDLFAPEAEEGKFLQGVLERLDYFQELGITLIHILPVLKSSGDAGFAVDSYQEIDKHFGTMDDLKKLIKKAHEMGIKIMFDFVLNHTSDHHPWAIAAKNGNRSYQEFYIFRQQKETWPTAPDIFPEHSPGYWDYVPELDQWVLSTFYKRHPNKEPKENFPFAQWDLNYKNPQVLLAMMENLFFLANQGVDTFRLDAVPFLWKKEDSSCQSLPQTHLILKLMRFGLNKVAPRTTFLAEACQPPQKLVRYFDQDKEVQQAYHFDLMTALWHALATETTENLKRILQEMPPMPSLTQWMVFQECHDEITFQDLEENMAQTLWDFFQNKGQPFRERPNQAFPEGVSGTTYTLLAGDIKKITLLWAVKMSLGGTPLIYMGEELGVENDYSYLNDPGKAADSRFVKRTPLTEEAKARRRVQGTKESLLFQKLQELIAWRKQHPALALTPSLIETNNPSVLGYQSITETETLLMLANFSGQEQIISLSNGQKINLQPYEFRWWQNL